MAGPSRARVHAVCHFVSAPRSPFPPTLTTRMTRVKGAGDTRWRGTQRLRNGHLAPPPPPPRPRPGPCDPGTAPGPPPRPHLLLNGARQPATAPAPGPVAVLVLAATAQWTGGPPARRVLWSRAAPHASLTPAPLHLAGVTVGRIRIAAGLPYKTDLSVLTALAAANLMQTTATLTTDAYVHDMATGVTTVLPHLANVGLRRKASATTPGDRALREDRRAPHAVPLGGARRDGRQAPHQDPFGGGLLKGRRVPHKAPLGGALVVSQPVPHKVPPEGALLDGRRAPHAALCGGARHDDRRTTSGARTVPPPL